MEITVYDSVHWIEVVSCCSIARNCKKRKCCSVHVKFWDKKWSKQYFQCFFIHNTFFRIARKSWLAKLLFEMKVRHSTEVRSINPDLLTLFLKSCQLIVLVCDCASCLFTCFEVKSGEFQVKYWMDLINSLMSKYQNMV